MRFSSVRLTAVRACIGWVALGLALCTISAHDALAQVTTPDPSDAYKPYLSIFTHADYASRPTERQLVANVQTGDLYQFAKQSHFKHYTTDDPLYRTRFASMFPESALPVICVQRSDGAYWYKASGDRIPRDANGLSEEIKFYIQLDPALDTSAKQQICPPGGCPPDANPSTPWPAAGPWPELAPQGTLPDSEEMIARKMPVRDSFASMVWITGAVLACMFLMFVVIVAVIVMFFIRPQQ